ncbi:hypothetical protein HO133_001321 [Letharia lupina]|uniref:BZIP domain-containing protein n=1 Tax=Letharia lupina TaxID=560253 RepID=A0A8H6CF50_9LECA|nr:uncharacterized protein HO133_001321 [Letharia lupina]KAF6222235.1 hypothetical protein HO133_001321 [Letharia lupina]
MTAATQGYISPNPYGAANMFARNIAKNNDFIKTFGNTPTNNHTIEPQQTEKYGATRDGNPISINTDESSFFDFEPSSRAESPYQNQFSTPGASSVLWSNEASFRPFTPPSSASFSPKSWPYDGYKQGTPSNIFTNIHPANTRAHYGQVTPPDDENDNESLLDFQLRDQLEQHKMQPPQDEGKGKRKRNSPTNDSTSQSPPKRTRKYASRGSNKTNEPIKPEDVKRSKFLERNRVAASKCRQKKKEWTQNLENRARDLQKNNTQLRLVVDSCRQEVLFLRGELLKHSQCDCESIQTYIKSGANNFADHKQEDDLFNREISPIGSRPRSRPGSIDSESGENNLGSTSPPAERSNASIADDDNALEALLTSSMKHDTSDEGIASAVAIAG